MRWRCYAHRCHATRERHGSGNPRNHDASPETSRTDQSRRMCPPLTRRCRQGIDPSNTEELGGSDPSRVGMCLTRGLSLVQYSRGEVWFPSSVVLGAIFCRRAVCTVVHSTGSKLHHTSYIDTGPEGRQMYFSMLPHRMASRTQTREAQFLHVQYSHGSRNAPRDLPPSRRTHEHHLLTCSHAVRFQHSLVPSSSPTALLLQRTPCFFHLNVLSNHPAQLPRTS